MAQTQTNLRQRTAREIGLSIYRTGTFDGSGGDTVSQGCAALKVLNDNEAIGAWIYPTGGADAGSDFQVTDSVQSTGVLTFRPPASAALDGDTFELLPFRASNIHEAINSAIVDLAARDILERKLITRAIVTGSPSYNADFAYWTGTNQPAGYTVNSGTPTLSRAVFPAHSDQCMLLNAGVVEVDTERARYFNDFYDEEVTLWCWVISDTASESRIGINLDGSTTWSSYHSGDGAPELLSVTVSVGTALNSFIPTFSNTGDVGYFGDWWLEPSATNIEEYPWVYELAPKGPDEIQILTQSEHDITNPRTRTALRKDASDVDFQYSTNQASSTGVHAFIRGLPHTQGQRLIIEARAPLSQVSADTDVVEVTERQGRLIAKLAAHELLSDYRNRANPGMARKITDKLKQLEEQIEALEDSITTNEYAADLPWVW
jgi:hypothetical protein